MNYLMPVFKSREDAEFVANELKDLILEVHNES